MTDAQRIAEALNRARRNFPPKLQPDPNQLDAYVEDLVDLPVDAVVQAIRECRRTAEEYFPSVGQIRKRVTEVIGATTLVDPESAWGEVRREAMRVGYNRPRIWHKGEFIDPPEPQFSSPMIAAAVEAIGWRDICLTDDDDLPTVRAQFREALRAIQRRAQDQVASGRAPAGPALTTGTVRGPFRAIADIVTDMRPASPDVVTTEGA